MKGVVFTEFLEMVEDRFSPEMADRIIEAAELPSGGVYTTVHQRRQRRAWPTPSFRGATPAGQLSP